MKNKNGDGKHMHKSGHYKMCALAVAGFVIALANALGVQAAEKMKKLSIAEQGSFQIGGSERTVSGQTRRFDHMYVFYQIPASGKKKYPIVLVHGGGQSGKQWESTPDGREGFQTLLLRLGYPVYVVDFGGGRAGFGDLTPNPQACVNDPGHAVSCHGVPIPSLSSNETVFQIFRFGETYPNFFPDSAFPKSDPKALDQMMRQGVPNTGYNEAAISDDIAALFDRIGPAILITHSASGRYGWLAATKTNNIAGIVSYEPTSLLFPSDGRCASNGNATGCHTPNPTSATAWQEVPRTEFSKLRGVPIQIVNGDHIPTTLSPLPFFEARRQFSIAAGEFVRAVAAAGGDATVLSLPAQGLVGNTHFMFADTNNKRVADLLATYLKTKRLDKKSNR